MIFTEEFLRNWLIKSWESKHWRKMRNERVDGRKIIYEQSLTMQFAARELTAISGVPADRMGREAGT